MHYLRTYACAYMWTNAMCQNQGDEIVIFVLLCCGLYYYCPSQGPQPTIGAGALVLLNEHVEPEGGRVPDAEAVQDGPPAVL